MKYVVTTLLTLSVFKFLRYLEPCIKSYIKYDFLTFLVITVILFFFVLQGCYLSDNLWKVKSVLGIMPNISGKYKITGESTYGGGTIFHGEMIIRQYDKNIYVDCKFEDSATSYSEGWIYEDKDRTWKASVLYTNKPNNFFKKDKWETHNGNMVMDNISSKKITECYYFNHNRDTKGSIKCEYIQKKRFFKFM